MLFNIVVIFAQLVILVSHPGVAEAADYTVGTAADLNQAIIAANTNGEADTIALSANINLTGTLSTITSEITIEGNGYTLDGVSSYRVLSSSGTLTINNLTNTNGLAVDGGGAGLLNAGTLTVNYSTFSSNSATTTSPFGGGINNDGGTVTINNSTFSGNSASIGGGIRNSGVSSTLTINNSTFSGNSAVFGGGVSNVNNGTLTINNSTFSGNSAGDTRGGGIRNDATLHFSRTIIANSASGGDCSSTVPIDTNSYNLVEDNTCSPAFSGEPNLDTLADNGGPTQTHALQSSSSAIDLIPTGTSTGGIDQRGAARDFDGDDSGSTGTEGDIGAYEYRAPVQQCGVSGGNTYTFESVSIDLLTGSTGDIDCITVDEAGADHLAAPGPASDGNFWHITAINSSGNPASGYSVNLTLPHNNLGIPMLCRYPGTSGGYGWDCFDPTTSNNSFATLNGVTQFSDWTMGDDVGPAAVTISTIDAQSAPPLAGALLAFAFAIAAGFIVLKSFKHQKN